MTLSDTRWHRPNVDTSECGHIADTMRRLPAPMRGNKVTYDSETKGFGCRVTAGCTRLRIELPPQGRRPRAPHRLRQLPGLGTAAAVTTPSGRNGWLTAAANGRAPRRPSPSSAPVSRLMKCLLIRYHLRETPMRMPPSAPNKVMARRSARTGRTASRRYTCAAHATCVAMLFASAIRWPREVPALRS